MAPTVSGAHSCQLPSLSRLSLPHFVALPEKSEFLGLFLLASLKNKEAWWDRPSQGPEHVSALRNDRPRTDAVGLVPDCAVAFSTQTDVLDFLSQVN